MSSQRLSDYEIDEFLASLAHMRESELARLLEMVESLVVEIKRVSLHNNESPAAAVTLRHLLTVWNAEVRRVLKTKWQNDAVPIR